MMMESRTVAPGGYVHAREQHGEIHCAVNIAALCRQEFWMVAPLAT